MSDLNRLAHQLAPIGTLAFVQSEKRLTSAEGLEKWWPHLGPHALDDQNIRYAVFSWNLVEQGWQREVEFGDLASAVTYAEAVHKRLFGKWQLRDLP